MIINNGQTVPCEYFVEIPWPCSICDPARAECSVGEPRKVLRFVCRIWANDLFSYRRDLEPLDVATWFQKGHDIPKNFVDGVIRDEQVEELAIHDVERRDKFCGRCIVNVPHMSLYTGQPRFCGKICKIDVKRV